MASHGRVRGGDGPPKSEDDRRKQAVKIAKYKDLVEEVNTKIRNHELGQESLQLTTKLLVWNPEYYTIWNHRRRIILHILGTEDNPGGDDTDTDKSQTISKTIDIISSDLQFLVPLLQEFPKCYWIWKYRLWLLELSSDQLPKKDARAFWEQELRLVGKMLTRDSRNFHGWGYRQTVVEMLESPALQVDDSPRTLTEQEFEYTTQLVNTQLSNFSAWHRRSKLIPKLLDERGADKAARKKMLDDELSLIERALWGGGEKDSSLWFYHQYLMSNFDTQISTGVIVPDLTNEEREQYLAAELDKILDMLDGAEDCKWIYQALIDLCVLYQRVNGQLPDQAQDLGKWTRELVRIDPRRRARWESQRAQVEQLSSRT